MKIVNVSKQLLDDLAHLRLPATGAGVAALVVELIPGISLSGTAVAALVTGIGVLAYVIEGLLQKPSVPAVVATTPTVVKDVENVIAAVEKVVAPKTAAKKAAVKKNVPPPTK